MYIRAAIVINQRLTKISHVMYFCAMDPPSYALLLDSTFTEFNNL